MNYKNYKIVLVKAEEGYSVSVPGLPGCWSQGSTEEEALANVQDAIQEYPATRVRACPRSADFSES
jgi:predicted RNase H-like HicB family nuclease